ncbi:MAG: hypothetical protein LBS04_01945 [Tannerellaceae bacterium]|nr:hypothetical protein [Tannerellaceae bacterium]
MNAVNFVLGTVKDSRLLHEIYQDKPYFQDCMQYYTFQNIYCVQPKLDNVRIISQSGSFLLFPKQMLSEAWGDIRCNALSISNSKKKNILDDICLLNIKNDTMFGELDKVCGYVKSKYRKE